MNRQTSVECSTPFRDKEDRRETEQHSFITSQSPHIIVFYEQLRFYGKLYLNNNPVHFNLYCVEQDLDRVHEKPKAQTGH